MNKKDLTTLIREWNSTPAGKRERMAKVVEEYQRSAAKRMWGGYKEQAQNGMESLRQYDLENRPTVNELAKGPHSPFACQIVKWLEAKPEERKPLEILIEKEYLPQASTRLSHRQDALDELLVEALRTQEDQNEVADELAIRVAQYLDARESARSGQGAHTAENLLSVLESEALPSGQPPMPSDDEIRERARRFQRKPDRRSGEKRSGP